MPCNTLILRAAYGRQYATLSELATGWKSGLDFKIVSGPYCSIRDKGIMEGSNIYFLLGDKTYTLQQVEAS